ncbi:transcriptional regulator [Bacteroides pyogenes JCM 10003]|nr:transcriptional regulator [Bacteroides pyogenes JCM 10003]
MGTGCTPEDTYGSHHSGYGRNGIGHNGRIFSMATDAYLLLVCRTDADYRQFYQRFIRLSERYGPGRPPGPRTRLRTRWISPKAMRNGIIVTIVLACLVGSMLLFYAGWELIIVGLLCILFAFLYTTGPYPLSYHGWGDLLVIVFFGFVSVGGTYYVQSLTWTPDVIVASLVCGLLIDTLLVVNNYRDREADAQSGKRTLVVRLGEEFGQYLYLVLGFIAAFICLWFLFEGHIYAGLFPQFYVPLHFATWRKMVRIHSGKRLNIILGETSRNMMILGSLLSIGFLLDAHFPYVFS